MHNSMKVDHIAIFFILSCILPLVSSRTAYAGVWTAAGSMSIARYEHTATLLQDGRVLVAGGHNKSGPPYDFPSLTSAEFYDPSTDSWTAAPSMSTPRYGHSATLLQDNRVLVAGGVLDNSGGGYLSSAEIYDPMSNSWSPAASMSETRFHHSATLLQDGRVLVVSGNPYGPSEELYDPATNSWSRGDGFSEVVWDSATLLQDGRVLVAGGSVPIRGQSGEAFLFEPLTNSWTAAASMSTARVNHSATLLPDGRVLVAGGSTSLTIYSSAEIYDPSTNSWSNAASMPIARAGHSATLLPDGHVLVFGGFNDSPLWLSTAATYNPSYDFWRVAASMSSARVGLSAVRLPDGRVLVTGGYNVSTGGFLSSADLYDPYLAAESFPWQLFLPPIINNPKP